MKNVFILSYLILLSCFTNAQNGGYIPVLNSGYTWISQEEGFSSPPTSFQYTFSQDSVLLNSNYYFKRLQSRNEDGSEEFIQGYYREEAGVVYRGFEGNFAEIPVFDITLNLGDTLFLNDPSVGDNLAVINLDTVVYTDNIPRKRLEMMCTREGHEGSFYWIEGIGETESGVHCAIDGVDTYLRCVWDENGEIFFTTITSENNCWLTTNTNEIEQSKISIYPIPAQSYINIQYDGAIENIDIYTIEGRKLKSFAPSKVLSISEFQPGMYFLKIYLEQSTYETTFVKM